MTLDDLAAEMRDAEAVLKTRHEAGELTDAEYCDQAISLAKTHARRMRALAEQAPT